MIALPISILVIYLRISALGSIEIDVYPVNYRKTVEKLQGHGGHHSGRRCSRADVGTSLQRIGIDYVVLESRAEIASQVEAPIAIRKRCSDFGPARIFDDLLAMTEPLTTSSIWSGSGKDLNTSDRPKMRYVSFNDDAGAVFHTLLVGAILQASLLEIVEALVTAAVLNGLGWGACGGRGRRCWLGGMEVEG